MRRTSVLLLVLLAVSVMLLVSTVYSSPMPTSSASPAHIPAPVAAHDSSRTAYDNPTPDGNPVPTSNATPIPNPSPAPTPTPNATETPTPTPTPTPVTTDNSSSTTYDNPTQAAVVAAHDSLQTNGADFVCDGLNDQAEIQAAIDALPADGGRVLLLEGTYNISPEGYIDLVSGLTLEGQGSSTVLLKGSPASEANVLFARYSTSPHSDIQIMNLKIDLGNTIDLTHGLQAYYIDGLVLQGVEFVSGSRQGKIYIAHSSHVEIVSCNFEGTFVQVTGETTLNDDTAIDSEDILVQDCAFRNTPDGRFALGNIAKNWRIMNNDFRNCGYTAIDIANSPDAIVSGNTIDTCVWHGIYSEGGRRLVITNNTVANIPEGYGIVVAMGTYGYGYGGDVLIEGNIVSNCKAGIVSRGVPKVTITTNQIDHTKWHGIYLETKTVKETVYYADDCIISNNRIFDFGRDQSYSRGIMLSSCQRCEVYDNEIDSNNNANADQAIREYGDADYNIIQNNTITGTPTGILAIGPQTVVQFNQFQ